MNKIVIIHIFKTQLIDIVNSLTKVLYDLTFLNVGTSKEDIFLTTIYCVITLQPDLKTVEREPRVLYLKLAKEC